ncbi:MAG: hypothetical protein GHCLOJNM_01760 [bacterium]|nr:hypothetical protein [bacterium]
MISVDTNILVRLLTRDDPAQARRATELFEANSIHIPKTVLLECEWVLRYTYELPRTVILESFRRLCGLSQVVLEDPIAVVSALEAYERGIDFADALHWGSSSCSEAFATFDRGFARRASRLDSGPCVQVI